MVLPISLGPNAIALAHEDHSVMTKHKQRIRIWWPQMDTHIEENIKSCHPCQKNQQT